ncbi:uncharacterized protein LOC132334729 isoform X5 [Haemorhous mexicanus]|uniref:uncharacterized protein LOC132334729 isoform X5 n=1 Tax=Haemorhous mexicanus TaxID=30427 RepID=UPI0028BD4E27|nr:uncharacterized protein LOC132334729 isoform X5 [Haemorhous mexicanus]
MSSHKTMFIENRSNIAAHFQWKAFPTEEGEIEEKRRKFFIVSSKDCAIRCSLRACTLGISPANLVTPKPPSFVLEYKMASQVHEGRCSQSLTAVRIFWSRASRAPAFSSEWSASCNIPADLNSLDLEIPKVLFVAHLDPKGSRKRFQILSTCAEQLLFQPGFPTAQKTLGMGGRESQTGGGSHQQDDLDLKSGIHSTETRKHQSQFPGTINPGTKVDPSPIPGEPPGPSCSGTEFPIGKKPLN